MSTEKTLNPQYAETKQLAEVFLFIGVQQLYPQPTKSTTIILDMYPHMDNHHYLEEVDTICFPNGHDIVELGEEEAKTTAFYEPTVIYYSLAQKRFATSLVFYSKLTVNDDYTSRIYRVPKAFCLISKLPIFDVLK